MFTPTSQWYQRIATWVASADTRLLVVVGPPGVGKTCALTVAAVGAGTPVEWMTSETSFLQKSTRDNFLQTSSRKSLVSKSSIVCIDDAEAVLGRTTSAAHGVTQAQLLAWCTSPQRRLAVIALNLWDVPVLRQLDTTRAVLVVKATRPTRQDMQAIYDLAVAERNPNLPEARLQPNTDLRALRKDVLFGVPGGRDRNDDDVRAIRRVLHGEYVGLTDAQRHKALTRAARLGTTFAGCAFMADVTSSLDVTLPPDMVDTTLSLAGRHGRYSTFNTADAVYHAFRNIHNDGRFTEQAQEAANLYCQRRNLPCVTSAMRRLALVASEERDILQATPTPAAGMKERSTRARKPDSRRKSQAVYRQSKLNWKATSAP